MTHFARGDAEPRSSAFSKSKLSWPGAAFPRPGHPSYARVRARINSLLRYLRRVALSNVRLVLPSTPMRYILGGPLSPGHDSFDFANELRVSVAPRESLFLSTRCALTRQALARGERSKSVRCFLRASRGAHRGRRSRVFPPPARGRGKTRERRPRCV